MCSGGVRLRAKSGTLLQLLSGDAARFRAERQEFFGDFHHLASAFELVVGGLSAQFDLLRHAGEIFLCLSELRFVFGDRRAFPPAVEKILADVNAERAEIAGQKGNIVLVAVTGERLLT